MTVRGPCCAGSSADSGKRPDREQAYSRRPRVKSAALQARSVRVSAALGIYIPARNAAHRVF